MVFYRNTHNSRGGNIIEDVPALCVYLSSSLYISHKRPAIIGSGISADPAKDLVLKPT